MRIPLPFLVCVVTFMALLDWRIFAVLRRRVSRRAARIHLLLSALVWCVLAVAVCLPRREGSDDMLLTIMWMLFAVASVVIGKLVFVAVDLVACLPRLWHRGRVKALTAAGAVLGVAVFAGMWWGALINRYRIDVREVEVEIPDLPASFDGFTVAQISDLHVGTFGTDTTFIHDLVERVNSLGADAIVFTGDIVNRHTSELDPFTAPLSRLKAPCGVYSILGNHDYGDYYDWASAEEKRASMDRLIELQRGMGWNLMLDSHEYIRRDNDSIAIVGVENIGDPPFPRYGSLERATEGMDLSVPSILLTHNPAHWDTDVAAADRWPFALTLSGHTHAMQIELFGLSPAAWRYDHWGGLYTDADGRRKLYVNIGAGTVGMPMRFGATPEVTLFTLRKPK